MSKVAAYLNEYLTGEVIAEGSIVDQSSTDASVLMERPEMVAQVANTSDIRKITRFCFQLAEKGHVMAVTTRGEGTDENGGAIGSGIIVSQSKYMNRVVGIDTKQRLIHVQAGASYSGVAIALSTHRGLTLPPASYGESSGTVGGAIASDSVGFLHQRYGTVGDAVQQLEVVLASGEVLQTGRISKRELNAKKGLHTFEGDIYRKIDNLISDNAEAIKTIQSSNSYDSAGYSGISSVRKSDGSFDLTPLFIGSQGTIGIISEAILKAQFVRSEVTVVLSTYKTQGEAREAADLAVAHKAISVEVVDGRLLARATSLGRKRDFMPKSSFKGGLVIAIFDDFGAKNRERQAKKLVGALHKSTKPIFVTEAVYSQSDLAELFSLRALAKSSPTNGEIVPSVFGGAWLPVVKIDTFLTELKKLEKEQDIQLPYWVDIKTGFIDLLPVIDMKKVSNRQKLIKLLSELSNLVQKFEGSLAGRGGDGRLKSAISSNNYGEAVAKVYQEIKNIFDPHKVLSPGVKQAMPIKDIATQINAWCRSEL